MKIIEKIKKTMKKSLEELNKYVDTQRIVNGAKVLLIVPAFVRSILYSLSGSVRKYQSDIPVTTIIEHQKADKTDKLNNYISVDEIIKIIKNKDSEFSKLLQTSSTNPKIYEYKSMIEEYPFLSKLDSYKNRKYIGVLSAEEYEKQMNKDKLKNNKTINLSDKQMNEILEEQKAKTFARIESLKFYNNITANLIYKKLGEEKSGAFIGEIEDKKIKLNNEKEQILRIGNFSFGEQMKNLDDINQNIEKLYINISSLEKVVVLDKDINVIVGKMNNIISKNELNGKLLEVSDKQYFVDSTNLLLDIQKEIKNGDYSKVDRYTEMVKNLENNISPTQNINANLSPNL